MIKILVLFSLMGFSKVSVEVHGFFSHADKEFIYLQLDPENQIVLNKKFLTKSQTKEIFGSEGKELNIAVAPKALVRKQKTKAKPSMLKKFEKHKKKKARKALKEGK